MPISSRGMPLNYTANGKLPFERRTVMSSTVTDLRIEHKT
jgi:hypothetical protein